MAVTYNYLTAATLQTFAQSLLQGVNTRIEQGYMVQTLGTNPDFESSAKDAVRVPSVAAVKTALRAVAGAHLKVQVVEGEFGDGKASATLTALVTTVTGAAPRTDTIYLQKDNATDTTWTMYIYCEPDAGDPYWIDIGNTDLSFDEIDGRLDALETVVGSDTVEGDVHTRTGLVKKVYDLEQDLNPDVDGSTGAQVVANKTAIGGLLYEDDEDDTLVTGGTGLAKAVYDLQVGKVDVSSMVALELGTIVSDALKETSVSTDDKSSEI